MTQPHTLTITDDGVHAPDYQITCPGVTDRCRSYVECHIEGCDHDELDEHGDGYEQHEHHGIVHHDIRGDWMLATGDCWLTVANMPDSLLDQELPAGQYEVTGWTDCADFGDLCNLDVRPFAQIGAEGSGR